MQWSPAFILLLVGATIANQRSAWKDGKEYTYKVRSRTLTAFNPQSKQYSGILMEAQLDVQPNGPDALLAKVSRPRYSQIHTRLEKGWDSEIPQSQLNLQNFPLSGHPFEIKIKNGVVDDLVVDKNVPTWEVNILKSIVSQLQVDTQGENAIKSKHNQFPENNRPYALFKTMEDSVGGNCEVLYDISPLPEQALQNKPELVPIPKLHQDGDVISIVKTKNYSECDQRVSFHSGLSGRNKWEPGSNDNKGMLSRSSVSRIVITGSLDKFTIQSSVTTNKVVLRPDQQENQQGLVASKMNLTLNEVTDVEDPIRAPSHPQSTGNLVYNYNSPFESISSRRRSSSIRKKERRNGKDNSEESRSSKRKQNYSSSSKSDESSSESDSSESNERDDEDTYLQPKPKLMEAPSNPLLPYFIGNEGISIKKSDRIDPIKAARNIAQQIGSEMQHPDKMPQEQTLEKFTILTRLIRTMNAEQIADTQRDLYEHPQSSNQLSQNDRSKNARRNAWEAFRDAVAQAGTGPALVNVKQWIRNKQIQGNEAADIVVSVADSAQTPTSEYMDAFFELASMDETKKQPLLRNAAIESFADLIRHAIVNKQSAHNRYPVHAFGKLLSRKNKNLHEKYIPYMAEELKSAVEKGDSKKIQIYTMALGRTADPKILSVMEPYLEGRKQVSPYQRLIMVLSLSKLATVHPKMARSVLYKIYSNSADHHEIRSAAVFLLMKTDPPVSMLQRMAEYTNHDSSKHVNSAVKSAIESLAQLDGEGSQDIANAARAAMPLLTSESYGLQYSRAYYKNSKSYQTHSGFAFQAKIIGGDDSIIPKGVYITMDPTYRGIKGPKLRMGGAVSSIQDIWDLVQDKLQNSDSSSQKKNKNTQSQKFSPERIAKLLNIEADDPEQVEGYVSVDTLQGTRSFSFDNHSIEKIPEKIKEFEKSMRKGENFERAKFDSYEVTMSFPTETGYPFTFMLKVPTLLNIKGESRTKSDEKSSSESPIPESAKVKAKVQLVYGLRVQQRLGFVTPFEHQHYLAGIDQTVQFYLPVETEVEYDSKKNQARMKIQANQDKKEFNLLQFKSKPFTSKYDILSLEPVSSDKNTHIIRKDSTKSSQIEYNDHNNRQLMQFSWEKLTKQSDEERESRENKEQNAMRAAAKLARSIATLVQPDSESLDYEKYSIKLTPSSDLSAELTVSMDSSSEENKGAESSENWSPNANVPHLGKDLSKRERKQRLMKEASKNINNAKANAVDISLQLNAVSSSSLDVTAAVASSNVDQQSRALLYASVQNSQGHDYYLSAALEAKIPNTESLDYEETLKANTRTELDAEIKYGRTSDRSNSKSQSKIKIQGKMKQTEDRENLILHSRSAVRCSKEQSQEGNKLSSTCQRLNRRAAAQDKGELVLTFENESEDYSVKEMLMRGLDYTESAVQDLVETRKTYDDKEEKNKISIEYRLSPNDQAEIAVTTRNGKVEFRKIDWGSGEKENYGSNEDDQNRQEYEPLLTDKSSCYLDKTEAETFDSHRYPLELGKCWHVAMTTYPKSDPDRPSQQQEIPEDMEVSILTKENSDGQKELMITLGGNEIEFNSHAKRQLSAKVNGKSIELSRKRSYEKEKNDESVLELFELQDKSIKLVSEKYNIEVVYDGQRASIQAGDRYRDAVRGLCGNFNGEPSNDQKTPKGCLLQSPEEFSATYALTKDERCEGPARQNAEKAKRSECSDVSPQPGNVISDREAGRNNYTRSGKQHESSHQRHCTHYRTKVMKSDDKICFSLKPVPTCSSSCKPSGMQSKTIQFHCVPRNTASENVAKRVESGANPDLSQKRLTMNESYQVPISCKA